MKLTDLDPRWLVRDGQRVGFIFKSPTNPHWYQACMFAPTPIPEQWKLFNDVLGAEAEEPEWAYTKVQACREECGWACSPTPEQATFDTISVMPSIDGSAGGLWHGFITNGATA